MSVPLSLFDFLEYEIPSKARFSDGHSIVFEDTVAKAKEKLNNPKLAVVIKATHAGVLINNRVYPGVHMKASVGSWLKDYAKPILDKHPDIGLFGGSGEDEKVLGRVTKAKFVQLTDDQSMRFDFETPGAPGAEGSGYIELVGVLTDQEAIEEVLDNRKLTVSTGADRPDKFICSVCGKNWVEDSPCEHEFGKTYTLDSKHKGRKKLAYGITGRLKYNHIAFTWRPADYVARIESTEVLDSWKDCKYLNCKPSIEKGQLLGLRLIDSQSGSFLDMDLTNPNMSSSSTSLDAKVEDTIHLREKVLGPDAEEASMSQPADIKKAAPADSKTETKTDPVADATKAEKPEEKPKAEDPKTEPEDYSDTTENQSGVSVMGEVELEDHAQLLEWYAANPNDKEIQDAKLTTATRKALPNSAFCGPARSFPAHDKPHIRNALARLGQGFPKGATPQVKARIRACVMRKAKSAGVSTGDSQDAELQAFGDANVQATTLRTLAAQVDKLESDNRRLKVELQEAQNQRDQYKGQVDSVQEKNRELLVDRIIDLEVSTGKKNVRDYQDEAKLKERKEELLKREFNSLLDTANDLQKEMILGGAAGSHPGPGASKASLPVTGLGDSPRAEKQESTDPASKFKKDVLSMVKGVLKS